METTETAVAARRLEPPPCTVEPLLAACGERLAALPQLERLLEARAARLEPGHDGHELVAGLLVAQAREIDGVGSRAGGLAGHWLGGCGLRGSR